VVAGGDRLVGGLGQLTDGQEGASNFRQHDPAVAPGGDGRGGRQQRGYEWVGWKSTAEYTAGRDGQTEFVEMAFHFDADRNFTSATFHVNNAFSRDVRVFRAATFHFHPRNRVMTSLPVEFEYERDDVMELARHVTVSLRHGVGQRIVARLYFDARWIIISEVQFTSGLSAVNSASNPSEVSARVPACLAGVKAGRVYRYRVASVIPYGR